MEKRFVLKKQNTNIELTSEGRRRVTEHWLQPDRLKSLAANPVRHSRP